MSWTNGSVAASLELVQWLAIIAASAPSSASSAGCSARAARPSPRPLLAAVGVPPIVAVASPLPATVPGTLVAYRRYRRLGIGDAERHPHEHRSSASRRRSSAPSRPAGSAATSSSRSPTSSSLPIGLKLAAAAGADRGRPRRRHPPHGPHRRRRRHRRPARRAARQRRRLPPRAALPGRAQAADQDRPGLLAGRRQRPRPARHDRPRRPRPHRLDGDARVRHSRRSRCPATAPAPPCGCGPIASSGSTAGDLPSSASCSSRGPSPEPGEPVAFAAAVFLKSLTLKGFKSFAEAHDAGARTGRHRRRRAQRVGQVERRRRHRLGARGPGAQRRAQPEDGRRHLRRHGRPARRSAGPRSA